MDLNINEGSTKILFLLVKSMMIISDELQINATAPPIAESKAHQWETYKSTKQYATLKQILDRENDTIRQSLHYLSTLLLSN